MTTLLLKQHISKVICDIEDKDFLEAVYTIVSNKAEEISFTLDDEMKKDLDTRKANHKKNVSKSHTWQNVKKAALSQKA